MDMEMEKRATTNGAVMDASAGGADMEMEKGATTDGQGMAEETGRSMRRHGPTLQRRKQ